MLKPIICFLFSLCFLSINAQFDHRLILVQYKDGVTYLGEKLSEEDQIIKIKLKQRDHIENTIEVDRRTAFRVYDNQNSLVFENGKFHKTKGLFGSFNYGVGIGNSGMGQMNTSINRFMSNKLTIGVGAGFQAISTNPNSIFFTALFAKLYGKGRYFLTHKKKRLYATGTLGYGYGLPDGLGLQGSYAKGGLSASGGIGVSFASTRDTKYFLELVNLFQKGSGLHISTDQFDNNVRTQYDLWFKRIVFKFGFDF